MYPFCTLWYATIRAIYYGPDDERGETGVSGNSSLGCPEHGKAAETPRGRARKNSGLEKFVPLPVRRTGVNSGLEKFILGGKT